MQLPSTLEHATLGQGLDNRPSHPQEASPRHGLQGWRPLRRRCRCRRCRRRRRRRRQCCRCRWEAPRPALELPPNPRRYGQQGTSGGKPGTAAARVSRWQAGPRCRWRPAQALGAPSQPWQPSSVRWEGWAPKSGRRQRATVTLVAGESARLYAHAERLQGFTTDPSTRRIWRLALQHACTASSTQHMLHLPWRRRCAAARAHAAVRVLPQ